MVAVETVGQLTLEVPRPEGSSREQLEDSLSTLTFLLVNIWVLCAVVPCVSWKHTNFCMCQTAQAQAKFGAFASGRSKSGGEAFFLLGVVWRLDLPFCFKKKRVLFEQGHGFLSGQIWLWVHARLILGPQFCFLNSY